jgi:hypothetical protein
MSDLTIITNNVPREIIHGFDLSALELAEFDYYEEPLDMAYFKYKGNIYDLGEFMVLGQEGELADWDGIHSEGYFSGILIKLSDCGDAVTCGRYYS